MNDQLRSIILTVLKDGEVELHDNDNLRDDLGMSSLQLAELVVRIEDKFGKDIFVCGILNTITEIEKALE